LKRHDIEAATRELGGDIGLEIGERENEIRAERLDLLETRVDERRHARLLACLGRPHRVSGHADDAIAFAKQIQRLGGFLREADDSRRVFHEL
jgi:hypothetical protein